MILLIVIVSWNTREVLTNCLATILDSLQLFESSNFQTVVIDNASTDDSAQIVRQRFPWVKLIENHENVGFARANNQGIQASTGEYVLLLNSDTVLHPGALETLLTFMDENPQAGACGPRLLNGDGSLQPSVHPMLTPAREFWRLLFLDRLWPRATYRQERWDVTSPRPVEVIKGACLLVRRSTLDQIGLLDESYFMYTEEVDLCYRMAQAGWQLWYVPTAVITHYGGASTRQIYDEMYIALYRSKAQFFEKYGGRPNVIWFRTALAIAYGLRAAIFTSAAWFRPAVSDRAKLYRRMLTELSSL